MTIAWETERLRAVIINANTLMHWKCMQWRLYQNMQLKPMRRASKHCIIRCKWIVFIFGSLHNFLTFYIQTIEWDSKEMKRITFCRNWTRKSYETDRQWSLRIKQTNKYSARLWFIAYTLSLYLIAIYY